MSKELTAQQLANIFKVSLQTIHNYAAKGMPHTRTPGRQLRFNPAAVLQYCARHGYSKPAELIKLADNAECQS